MDAATSAAVGESVDAGVGAPVACFALDALPPPRHLRITYLAGPLYVGAYRRHLCAMGYW